MHTLFIEENKHNSRHPIYFSEQSKIARINVRRTRRMFLFSLSDAVYSFGDIWSCFTFSVRSWISRFGFIPRMKQKILASVLKKKDAPTSWQVPQWSKKHTNTFRKSPISDNYLGWVTACSSAVPRQEELLYLWCQIRACLERRNKKNRGTEENAGMR